MNVINRLRDMGLSVYEAGTLNYLCRTKKGNAVSLEYGYQEIMNCYCWKACFSTDPDSISYFMEEDYMIEALSNYANKRRQND